MLGDMLKVLGKVELSGRTGTLENIAAQQTAEAERFKLQEDFQRMQRYHMSIKQKYWRMKLDFIYQR